MSRRPLLAGAVCAFMAAGCQKGVHSRSSARAQKAASEIAAALRAHERILGSVEVTGAVVTILGGDVRLAVRDAGDANGRFHMHVLASSRTLAADTLDACILGAAPGEDRSVEEAASLYVTIALPPLVSRLKNEGLLQASRFSGTEPWGVPGYRGFAGLVLTRGAGGEELPEATAQAAMFSGLAPMRPDGKTHLEKVVLDAQGGRGGGRSRWTANPRRSQRSLGPACRCRGSP